jgi:hypothetical protein
VNESDWLSSDTPASMLAFLLAPSGTSGGRGAAPPISERKQDVSASVDSESFTDGVRLISGSARRCERLPTLTTTTLLAKGHVMAERIPIALRPTFQPRPGNTGAAVAYLLWTLAGSTVRLDGGCWEWIGNRHQDGYGYFEIDGTLYRVHRLVYEVCVSDIPDGLMVLHRCDYRSCCNPAHLYVGDALANITDCLVRGRHPASKLNNDAVRDIRRRAALAKNRNYSALAQEYGVSYGCIKDIVYRKRWKHVD